MQLSAPSGTAAPACIPPEVDTPCGCGIPRRRSKSTTVEEGDEVVTLAASGVRPKKIAHAMSHRRSCGMGTKDTDRQWAETRRSYSLRLPLQKTTTSGQMLAAAAMQAAVAGKQCAADAAMQNLMPWGQGGSVFPFLLAQRMQCWRATHRVLSPQPTAQAARDLSGAETARPSRSTLQQLLVRQTSEGRQEERQGLPHAPFPSHHVRGHSVSVSSHTAIADLHSQDYVVLRVDWLAGTLAAAVGDSPYSGRTRKADRSTASASFEAL